AGDIEPVETRSAHKAKHIEGLRIGDARIRARVDEELGCRQSAVAIGQEHPAGYGPGHGAVHIAQAIRIYRGRLRGAGG
ncbi:MAG: hypothetical protein ACJA1L_003192, partial [Paracoccaceae bacterium]